MSDRVNCKEMQAAPILPFCMFLKGTLAGQEIQERFCVCMCPNWASRDADILELIFNRLKHGRTKDSKPEDTVVVTTNIRASRKN